MVIHKVYGAEVDIEIPTEVFPTKEEIDAMEAATPGCQHGWFESTYENAKLHYRYWVPENEEKPKGVVIFMHGISTHTGKGLIINGRKLATTLMVDSFLEKGIAVYSFELYGHGFSEGTRQLIPKSWEYNKSDYIKFCNLVADRHAKKIPLFLMGESYGGCLSIHVAKYFQEHPLDGPSNFDSIILSAPAIEGDLPGFPVYQILRYGLAPWFPK
jgi:alpha-beta hydrolase superfamily lysophospholipase